MMIVEGDDQAVEMHARRQHHEDVEELMRGTPEIVFSWRSSLGPSRLFPVSFTIHNLHSTRNQHHLQ